jgi:hypothetical protein
MKDAEVVGIETSAALLELSLEEIVKGFMLAYKGYVTKREFDKEMEEAILDLNKDKTLGSDDKEKLVKLFEGLEFRHFSPLSTYEFSNHKDKLEYLRFVVSVTELIIGLNSSTGLDMRKAFRMAYRPLLNIDSKILKREISEGVALIGALDKSNIMELKNIREEGLYVSYGNRHFSYPRASSIHVGYLRNLALILLGVLDGVLLNLRNL